MTLVSTPRRSAIAAFALHGSVTKSDYDAVLIPDFEDRLAPPQEGFDLATVWADSTFGFGHFFGWDRCAVVSDVEWAKQVAKFSEFFGFLWPGEYCAISEAEAGQAHEWIAEPQR